jgi:hypothetical protein
MNGKGQSTHPEAIALIERVLRFLMTGSKKVMAKEMRELGITLDECYPSFDLARCNPCHPSTISKRHMQSGKLLCISSVA